MKTPTLLLFSVLVAMSAFSSFAGVGDRIGNGGIAVVCRDLGTQKIISADLLDLLETEVRDQRPLRPRLGNVDAELKETADRIVSETEKPELGKFFLEDAKKMKIVPIAGGFALPNPRDFNPRIGNKKKGCEYEVVGLYNDQTETLEVDLEIVNFLKKSSPQHYSAFLAHEVFYRQYRKRGTSTPDSTSDSTRLLIGDLYAKTTESSKIKFRIIGSGVGVGPGINAVCLAGYAGKQTVFLNVDDQKEQSIDLSRDFGGWLMVRIWKLSGRLVLDVWGTHGLAKLLGDSPNSTTQFAMASPVTRDLVWDSGEQRYEFSGDSVDLVSVPLGGGQRVEFQCGFVWR